MMMIDDDDGDDDEWFLPAASCHQDHQSETQKLADIWFVEAVA